MRIPAPAAACLAALLAIPSGARAFDDPQSVISALYAPYLENALPEDPDALMSVGLSALIAADREEADGGICRIAFDPFVDGQDFALSDLTIERVDQLGGTGEVDVAFRNFGDPRFATYAVVLEPEGWKIDDVVMRDEGGAPLYSYRENLTRPGC